MNQTANNTKNKMEQGYIISKKNNDGNIEFLELVFKDYSESRKAARKLVEKSNNEIIYQNLKGATNDYAELLQEISPDYWANNKEVIYIEIMKVKELINKRKINIQTLQEIKKSYLYDEVKM
jgi:hypothetical protein